MTWVRGHWIFEKSFENLSEKSPYLVCDLKESENQPSNNLKKLWVGGGAFGL